MAEQMATTTQKQSAVLENRPEQSGKGTNQIIEALGTVAYIDTRLRGLQVTMDGGTAAKIENTNNAPFLASLLTLESPPITSTKYAMTGEIKYENVQGSGYLEMWSHFQTAGKYFSRTLGPTNSGPMAVISGSSDWRKFYVPFDRTGTTYSVSKLEVNLYLPGKGVVYLRGVKLVQIETDNTPAIGVITTLTPENAPVEKTLEFCGVTWMPWRTRFEVQGDKLVSLPKVRPGFNYGHGGNGRGPTLITNVGNTDWRNYSVALTLCMAGVNPAFNPYGLPKDYGNGSVNFHIADAKESWNERGSSAYAFNINLDGSWTLGCGYNSYSDTPTGWFQPMNDGQRDLANGDGLKLDPINGNKYRIDVYEKHIQIWIDDEKIVDVIDEKMSEEIGGIRLDHGGVSINGGFECMIWLRDFSFRPL
jgi:hypothetical protein